ncbi:hypothetical protein [Virgisporangium aurantiacum]|uniref:Uncharacterized protein n=1 Tax=Virgisporangium aurantiacum TaxID=175570 RepID=A0A8J3ZC63_9ACTN|nr:hypothetical protein [Virgisporangium aurantiacum]GIJ60232.1 hypothetical protein Vau01_077480 [Virgisporangium aurantiacum]
MVGTVWRAVRPQNGFQRLLWWAGTLLLASGAVHLVVALVDGGSWWGPVSWRKPVVFGLSMGLLLWSMVWALRRQAQRWWVTVPAGLVGASLVLEVALITMQRWRGVPSHFNAATAFDSAVWSVIGMTIIVLTLGVLWSLVASLVRFRGSAATRIAVVAGFAAVLVAGAIGKDMAAIGEAAVDATGRVPDDILFGAAGSAKLAHAVGLHAIQVLGVLAILLDAGRLRARAAAWAMAVATTGYAAAFGAVTATAYAGWAPHDPTPAMAVLLVGGAVAVAVVGVVALWAVPSRVASGDADRDLERELGEAADAPVPAVARRAEA